MKNMMRNLMVILVSVFTIGAAQAERDGGLMAEMMAKKFPPKIITATPDVQACLGQVKLPGASIQDGGLMSEMLAARFPAKIITNNDVQSALALVKIPRGQGFGGLRTEMQQSQQKYFVNDKNLYMAANTTNIIDANDGMTVKNTNVCS